MKSAVFALIQASLLATVVAQANVQARFVRDVSFATQPTVQDLVTGLEWQGCAAGLSGIDCAAGNAATAYPWSEALAYCEGLSYGGRVDWRLPNRAELQSIADQRTFAPAIDAEAFPGTPSKSFWSSSSFAYYPRYAWLVYFYYGYVTLDDKFYNGRVRCVRN